MNIGSGIKGFDFHCHIDLHPNPPALIRRCEEDRVLAVTVTTTPKAWRQNLLWTRDSSYVHSAVGLHPELVSQRYDEICLLEALIKESALVGEVGLDGSPQHRASYERQKEVFARALAAAQEYGKRVVSIHSRRASRDTIALIERHTHQADVICILHWFSGSLTEARKAAEAGCYFSVNAAMLAQDRGRALVRDLPKDRVLTETDSPFMTINGRKSEPTDAINLLATLADMYGQQVQETRQQITKNAQRVMSFANLGFDE